MTKTGTAILILVGGALSGHAVHDFSTRYSPERIFSRQKAIIEMSKTKSKSKKDEDLDYLKKELKSLEGETDKKRCEFEKSFEAVVVTGSAKAAEEKLETSSYEPYSDCKDKERAMASIFSFHIAGAIMLLVGAARVIASLFKRRERNQYQYNSPVEEKPETSAQASSTDGTKNAGLNGGERTSGTRLLDTDDGVHFNEVDKE